MSCCLSGAWLSRGMKCGCFLGGWGGWGGELGCWMFFGCRNFLKYGCLGGDSWQKNEIIRRLPIGDRGA